MHQKMEFEYKVIDVADGSISSFLLGEGRIETEVLEAYLNAMAADGWRLVFMEKVLQRHLVISDRETLMITFERRVPEELRATRSARVIDDVIDAEQRSKTVGNRAAAGLAAGIVGAAILGSLTGGGSGNST